MGYNQPAKRRQPYGKKFTSIGNPRQRNVPKTAAVKRLSDSIARDIQKVAAPKQSAMSILYPETKYFDTSFNVPIVGASGNWTSTEVACDAYVDADGSTAAYTASALIPSAIGSGYGQVDGNRYKLKKIRARGQITRAPSSDQADMNVGTPIRS